MTELVYNHMIWNVCYAYKHIQCNSQIVAASIRKKALFKASGCFSFLLGHSENMTTLWERCQSEVKEKKQNTIDNRVLMDSMFYSTDLNALCYKRCNLMFSTCCMEKPPLIWFNLWLLLVVILVSGTVLGHREQIGGGEEHSNSNSNNSSSNYNRIHTLEP